MNKKERTLKKREELWITEELDAELLALLVWVLSSEEVRRYVLAAEAPSSLPVIKF